MTGSTLTPTEQGQALAARDMLVMLFMAVSREYDRRHPDETVEYDEDPAGRRRLIASIIECIQDRTLVPGLIGYIRGDDLEER